MLINRIYILTQRIDLPSPFNSTYGLPSIAVTMCGCLSTLLHLETTYVWAAQGCPGPLSYSSTIYWHPAIALTMWGYFPAALTPPHLNCVTTCGLLGVFRYPPTFGHTLQSYGLPVIVPRFNRLSRSPTTVPALTQCIAPLRWLFTPRFSSIL